MENIKKNKFYLWSIIIIFIVFLNSCTSSNQDSPYIGFFQVDLNKSELGVYESDTFLFKSLNLTINQDGTFIFNIDVPFIRSQKGFWKMKNIDGFDFLYLVYGKGQYATIEDEVNLTVGGDIYINNTRPKPEKQNVKKLFFNRIN